MPVRVVPMMVWWSLAPLGEPSEVGPAFHASHDPIQCGCLTDESPRIDPFAEIRWSGPMCFCSSPTAIMSAMRALLRASVWAWLRELERKETADKLSIPTVRMSRRTIMDNVATRANPRVLSLLAEICFV